MLGSLNHNLHGLQPRKRGPVPVIVDTWCTTDGYGAGTDVEMLLQLWPVQLCAAASPLLLFRDGVFRDGVTTHTGTHGPVEEP
jgi:hypothetical protein